MVGNITKNTNLVCSNANALCSWFIFPHCFWDLDKTIPYDSRYEANTIRSMHLDWNNNVPIRVCGLWFVVLVQQIPNLVRI